MQAAATAEADAPVKSARQFREDRIGSATPEQVETAQQDEDEDMQAEAQEVERQRRIDQLARSDRDKGQQATATMPKWFRPSKK